MKKLVTPIQKVLLRRHLCVGCTYPLTKIKRGVKLNGNEELITCKCNRKYVKDLNTNTYRRATFEEEYESLHKNKNIQ
jgi:hypothetical protein